MEKYRIAPTEQIMCDFLLAEGAKGIPIPTITTVLKKKVDVAALTYAVDAALAFHPYFATRLIREGTTFYWQKNSRTPVLSEKQIFEDFLYGDRSNHFFRGSLPILIIPFILISPMSSRMVEAQLSFALPSWNTTPGTSAAT